MLKYDFMKVCVIGAGYVGLVTAACLAELGNEVTCFDNDAKKVNELKSGRSPIFEPGLEELIKKNIGKTLKISIDAKDAVKSAEIIFIAVGTPSRNDGSADLKYVETAVSDVARALKHNTSYAVIAVKSTVPPKTTGSLINIVEKESGKKFGKFGIAMNPEFLREGNAIYDFMNPDRIIIGVKDDNSFKTLAKLYNKFSCPMLKTDLDTAEMIKYASNTFLAARVSLTNEIGNICKSLGIDVYDVMKGVGLDKRIGSSFLKAGIGFGGSCFSKDIQSLKHVAKSNNVEPTMLNAILAVNNSQPLLLIEIAKKNLKNLKDKKIAVLGLAFKPDSDDMRDAPSIKVINSLLKEGAKIKAYDPAATENAKNIFNDKIEYAKSLKEALDFSDTVFVLTEWRDFKNESLYKNKIVFDGRKIIDKKSNPGYEGICW